MENLFNVNQAAFILKVHPLTVRRYIKEGVLKAVKIGGNIRIKRVKPPNFFPGFYAKTRHQPYSIPENDINHSQKIHQRRPLAENARKSSNCGLLTKLKVKNTTYLTYMTYKTYKKDEGKTHGGYRGLISYQTTTIIYDLTVIFCPLYLSKFSRTNDQMVQAARSGRQNIAEGSQASVTSKKTELKLVGVARASLEELLLDYEDFLRQNGLKLWSKDDPKAKAIRALSYMTNRTYETYMTYIQAPESAANCVICLIHQANFLLDRQIQALEKEFLTNGGYTENLFKRRVEFRTNTTNRTNKTQER